MSSLALQQWVKEVDDLAMSFKPSNYGRVGVLYGGRSGEREVSLQSGQGVLDALIKLGIDAHPYDPGVMPIEKITQEKFDLCYKYLQKYGFHDLNDIRCKYTPIIEYITE